MFVIRSVSAPGPPDGLAERQLVGEREREVVPHQRLEVDRSTGELLVAGVELGERAVADDGVAHPPGGEVHHGVADVADLEVEHGDDAPVGLVELAGVPHDDRLPAP
jgi:hypothetical protein